MRGEAHGMEKWSDKKKLLYCKEKAAEQAIFFQKWCEMFLVIMNHGLRMIVENPYNSPNYLNTYFCMKAKLIDKDRRDRGDRQKKPTQYWFVNCDPEYNIYLESMNEVEQRCHTKMMGKKRSEIHPQYARRFIREFILDAQGG